MSQAISRHPPSPSQGQSPTSQPPVPRLARDPNDYGVAALEGLAVPVGIRMLTNSESRRGLAVVRLPMDMKGKEHLGMVAAQVTDSTFKTEVLESKIPVLVDFWAPWCGPCRMVSPVVEEIAEQYAEQVKVVKVNTDENPSTASQYGIRSIPTLMIFKEGQRVDMVVGAVPKTTLANTLEKYL
jgi:thioredoxin 1